MGQDKGRKEKGSQEIRKRRSGRSSRGNSDPKRQRLAKVASRHVENDRGSQPDYHKIVHDMRVCVPNSNTSTLRKYQSSAHVRQHVDELDSDEEVQTEKRRPGIPQALRSAHQRHWSLLKPETWCRWIFCSACRFRDCWTTAGFEFDVPVPKCASDEFGETHRQLCSQLVRALTRDPWTTQNQAIFMLIWQNQINQKISDNFCY
jgi:hypothetical protein